jgi:hypothetical protein
MIRSLHASAAAFDDPILSVAARKGAWLGGAVDVVCGILVGVLIGRWSTRKRPAASSNR